MKKRKRRRDICQGIETAQNYPREFQSWFWPRERPRNARGSMFETMLRARPELSSSLPRHPSLFLSIFPPDWSARPVIHRKHRMQTVTWVVGIEVLRGRTRGTRGKKAEVFVYVFMCAPSGARQFTAYILAALRRAMQRDGDAEILFDTERLSESNRAERLNRTVK